MADPLISASGVFSMISSRALMGNTGKAPLGAGSKLSVGHHCPAEGGSQKIAGCRTYLSKGFELAIDLSINIIYLG